MFSRKVEGVSEEVSSYYMEDMIDEMRPDLSGTESQQVKMLISWILRYETEKRPSAAGILGNPWFKKSLRRLKVNCSLDYFYYM